MSRPPQADPLDRPFPLSGQEAKGYGAITTFENAAGRVLVLHRVGNVRAAVVEACTVAEGLAPTFRVVAISTPTTIYTDLQGARFPTGNGSGHVGAQTPHLPEHSIVAGKWRHMLHERLRGSGREGHRDAPR